MRKKLCLIFTLIVSLFMFSGRVDAVHKNNISIYDGGTGSSAESGVQDVDLVCIYGHSSAKERFKLIQSGNRQYLYHSDNEGEKYDLIINNYELVIYDKNSQLVVDDMNFQESNTEKFAKINECPTNFALTYTSDPTNPIYSYYFYNDQTMFPDYNYWKYPFISKGDSDDEYNANVVPVDSNVFSYQFNYLYTEEVNKESNKWYARCSYKFYDDADYYPDYVTLYFNRNRYILINENSECGTNQLVFSIDYLNEFFVGIYNTCPVRLYMDNSSNDTTGKKYCTFSLTKKGYGIELYNVDNIVYVDQITPDEVEKIEDCKTLFGDNLLKKIDKIMDIVKIVVPILLIGFGIFDFTKAVFSGSEDAMKKSQKTFLKRIIAAILVFIAPIFVNFILDLANVVWSDIKADTCMNQID